MKLEELPAVYQASLDDATYEALFDDLSQLAACEVSVKHTTARFGRTPFSRAPPASAWCAWRRPWKWWRRARLD
jgi:hypothetical protein